ncbi:hypothetical protein AX16_008430 [Volvariella volvacea WC 439]|nr:hypothetical protein AX16_008430 [Volvariella volvacea WC 439]
MPAFANESWPYFVQRTTIRSAVDAPITGFIPVYLLYATFQYYQSFYGHSIGDQFARVYYGAVQQSSQSNLLNTMLECYITGALELWGTVLRAKYTQTNTGLYNGSSEIPSSLRYSINGTFTQQTMGWHQESTVLPLSLIVPSFIGAVSILVVFYTLVKTRNYHYIEGAEYWDSNDILHVVAAASAGGIREEFPAYHEGRKDLAERSEKVLVRLDRVEGTGKLGFVQS